MSVNAAVKNTMAAVSVWHPALNGAKKPENHFSRRLRLTNQIKMKGTMKNFQYRSGQWIVSASEEVLSISNGYPSSREPKYRNEPFRVCFWRVKNPKNFLSTSGKIRSVERSRFELLKANIKTLFPVTAQPNQIKTEKRDTNDRQKPQRRGPR